MKKQFIGLVLIILSLTLWAGENSPIETLLSKELKKGEAIIWYLFHSGWAVKTQNHFLVFDYYEEGKKPQQPSLNSGHININEISHHKIYVFVSHEHSDHYNPVILEWEKTVKNIKYIFGWKATDNVSHIHFDTKREIRQIDGLNVANIHHTFDNIPESAFLVMVDGLVIYHAGDHGHSKGRLNPTFKKNNDYLAKVGKKIDFIFVPTFGGVFDTIERLSPRVVFPMHDGGYEHQYKKFAIEAAQQGIKVKICPPAKRGDYFFYSKGSIKKIPSK